jgi:hypothetical protein
VRGRIVNADGTPARDRPAIRIKEPGLYGQIERETIDIDSEGRFQFQLCERVRYGAFAFAGGPGASRYSAPIEFMVREGDDEYVFVVNLSSEEWNRLMRKTEKR